MNQATEAPPIVPPKEGEQPPQAPAQPPKPTVSAEDAKLLKSIAKSKVDTVDKKMNVKELARLAALIGVAVDNMPKADMIRSIQFELNKPRPVIPDQAYMASPPTVENFELLESGEKYALRCVKCQEIPIIFQPGFDPQNPIDQSGNRLPFFHWPFQWRGPAHLSATALQNRSRENPHCSFCERRIPLFNFGKTLHKRAIVMLPNQED